MKRQLVAWILLKGGYIHLARMRSTSPPITYADHFHPYTMRRESWIWIGRCWGWIGCGQSEVIKAPHVVFAWVCSYSALSAARVFSLRSRGCNRTVPSTSTISGPKGYLNTCAGVLSSTVSVCGAPREEVEERGIRWKERRTID